MQHCRLEARKQAYLERSKGFEISLNAGSARAVAASDSQDLVQGHVALSDEIRCW